MRKYGIENFKWEIIECGVVIENLNERETYYILQHNSCILLGGHGYNMTLGGDGAPYGELNPSCWPKVKEMRRLQFVGEKNPSKRLDVREKIRQSLIGRELTEEHKKSISSGLMGHRGSVGSNNPKSKQFTITHPNGTTETIKGLREFCRRFNLNAKLMRRVANGKCENHKGFKCQYD